ncbi:MAG: hypothetical protein II700_04070, partial [Firmicutes bacterium]|nr:hypothetical protein [Bacillota bacterium]
QIVTFKDAVSVLRRQEPCAAFVFLNPVLTDAVSGYIASLRGNYAQNRRDVIEKLEKMMERTEG